MPEPGGKVRYIRKKDLTFLCKMRQNLSDECFKVTFRFSSSLAVCLSSATARKSLMLRFVPHNIGLNAITREKYIDRHVTGFSNRLYNPNANDPAAIACIDGTYVYIHNSLKGMFP